MKIKKENKSFILNYIINTEKYDYIDKLFRYFITSLFLNILPYNIFFQLA